ncbi:MAG TPA: hypothetical protein VN614_06360, partial [Rhodanobacter sp.]|nr:hypothetical protein [Rhodanobacter sp.]
SGFGAQAAPNSGENLPPGAAVFFHLPADYDGKPVKLSFSDASGKEIRSYTLPQQPKATEPASGEGAAKVAKLHPGMNRFLWNLRYPDVADVKGIYESPHSQGARPPVGPEVVPGTYYAQLSYAGHTQRQPFVVKLDPRLDTTSAKLQQRFDLLMQLRDSMGELGTALNQALDARTELEQAIAAKHVSGDAATQALAGLNRDIDDMVNLRIQSDEGALVYAGKLRARLSWLVDTVSASFVAPTPAMVDAADTYMGQERDGVSRLHADVAGAKAALH